MFKAKLLIKKPSGNVLLLSLLILAGGIAGALAIAVVVISELRQSTVADSGLVAFFDAESGLEQTIYDIRKGNSGNYTICTNTDCSYNTCALPPSVTTANCITSLQGCWLPNCSKQIKPASSMIVNLEPNDTFQVDLDPVEDGAVRGFKFSGWSHSPGITDLTAPQLEISYVMVGPDGTTIFRPNLGLPYSCVIAEGTDSCANSEFSNEDNDYPNAINTVYQVRVKALRGRIFNLRIQALNDAGNEIELNNYLSVKSRGEKSNIQQVLMTVIPKNLPVYGFPDYVVFSEETIVK